MNSDKEILKEAERFYQKLYTSSKPSPDLYSQIFFSKTEECKVGDSQKESCEGELTPGECLQALKLMENNKSPWSDGLPAEFYKLFWRDINVFLINALNAVYRKGTLSISQRYKIVRYLKNLLNCDYKIAAKAIASRMKNVLPTLINFDQTSFLKGRSIGENARLIDSIINFTDLRISKVCFHLSILKRLSTAWSGHLSSKLFGTTTLDLH